MIARLKHQRTHPSRRNTSDAEKGKIRRAHVVDSLQGKKHGSLREIGRECSSIAYTTAEVTVAQPTALKTK